MLLQLLMNTFCKQRGQSKSANKQGALLPKQTENSLNDVPLTMGMQFSNSYWTAYIAL